MDVGTPNDEPESLGASAPVVGYAGHLESARYPKRSADGTWKQLLGHWRHTARDGQVLLDTEFIGRERVLLHNGGAGGLTGSLN